MLTELEIAMINLRHIKMGYLEGEDMKETVDQIIDLLRTIKDDVKIVQECREGTAMQYVGKGIVVTNYQWWVDLLKQWGMVAPAPVRCDPCALAMCDDGGQVPRENGAESGAKNG